MGSIHASLVMYYVCEFQTLPSFWIPIQSCQVHYIRKVYDFNMLLVHFNVTDNSDFEYA